MERDDPAYGGQSEYTPLFLRIYEPVILGFLTRVVWRCGRRFWWSETGDTSARATWTWAPVPATSWNEPARLQAPPSPSSIPT